MLCWCNPICRNLPETTQDRGLLNGRRLTRTTSLPLSASMSLSPRKLPDISRTYHCACVDEGLEYADATTGPAQTNAPA